MVTRLTLIFLNIIFIHQLVCAKTIEVCSSCKIKSVTEAVRVADLCDTILVRKGLYQEGNILIDKALTIVGTDQPVFDGNFESEIFTITSDYVTVQGLVFQNVGTSYREDRAAIRVQKSGNFQIKDNTLLNTFFGIYLENARDGIIINNKIKGEAEEEMSSGNAIHLWYCKNIEILGNTLENHRDGIYLEFVDNSQITGNISQNNLRYGLHFMFSNDNRFSKNVFRKNGSGVAVMFSKHIEMWENEFTKNWGKSSYGLLLKEIYDTKITHNIIEENTIGIYVEGSGRLDYTENDFRNNGWAMKITGGCVDNRVVANNFIGNTFDLSVGNNINNNSFNGNYWSEYTGYDLDRDGIGDVPYRPVKLFNFIVNQTPEALILVRSFFVDLLNFSEKVSPLFTPENVVDNAPLVYALNWKNEISN